MNPIRPRRTSLVMTDGFLARLVRRTSVEALQSEEHRTGLRRVLGGRDLIAIGLGTMIGGGIFTTIGPGVAKAGPAIIIAFLLAGLASFFAALCYAELGSMVPIAGSAYTYAYATLGQLVAWIIGWDLILEYAVSAAPVAAAFSSSVQGAASRSGTSACRCGRKRRIGNTPVRGGRSGVSIHRRRTVDVVGALFVLALSALLVVGIKETATSNNAFVVIKIARTRRVRDRRALAVSPGEPRTVRAATAGARSRSARAATASSRRPHSSSSPTSASIRQRPPPKKRAIRNATCRSACSGRSRSER